MPITKHPAHSWRSQGHRTRFREESKSQGATGFVSVNVNYFSSTTEGLRLLVEPDALKYLATCIVYFADIGALSANDWCGELLVIHEFNKRNPMRKLRHDPFLISRRVIKHARWLEQLFLPHVLDHPERQLAPS